MRRRHTSLIAEQKTGRRPTSGLRLSALVAGSVSLAAGGSAFGQSAADVQRAQQQAQQAIQQQQQQDQLRRLQEEQKLQTPSGQDLSRPAAGNGGPAAGTCTDVKSVVLDGNTLLDLATRNVLTQPFVERCLTLADINRLLAALTNAYVARGYVTTRVYVPEQKIGAGVLELKVIEGRVESIIVKPQGSINPATVFPGVAGSILNLRDLEEATDQINRLASNSSHIDILPGNAPGESILSVTDEVSRRWQASLGFDNSGQASTGYDTTSASFSTDNLAHLNDYFNVTAHHSEAGPDAERHSDGGGVYWNVPYGYWNFSISANALHYGSVVSPPGNSFGTDGSANSQTLKADRLVYRDQSVKWIVSGDLTLKQTWNAIAGTRIDTSSADLSILTAGSSVSWSHQGTLLSASVGISDGFYGLGSTHDLPTDPDDAPHAQFTRWNYAASLVQLFSAGPVPLSFSSNLTGQYAARDLYGTEQIALGGLYTVRGFRLDNLSGSSGFYDRNDLGVPLTLARIFGTGAPEGEIKPYVGFDYGRVFHSGMLDGWTVGVDSRYQKISLGIAYSHPIATPSFLPREHGWLFARINVTY